MQPEKSNPAPAKSKPIKIRAGEVKALAAQNTGEDRKYCELIGRLHPPARLIYVEKERIDRLKKGTATPSTTPAGNQPPKK